VAVAVAVAVKEEMNKKQIMTVVFM
jgi:hypothetical protein